MKEQIEQGKRITMDQSVDIDDIAWNKHSSCHGVFLKHLVTGAETDGKFSFHLVRVQAGCEISEHIHQTNWELHEVVAGNAIGYLGDKTISYVPGTTIVIPEGKKHKVVAGEQDLFLFATFIPALV